MVYKNKFMKRNMWVKKKKLLNFIIIKVQRQCAKVLDNIE